KHKSVQSQIRAVTYYKTKGDSLGLPYRTVCEEGAMPKRNMTQPDTDAREGSLDERQLTAAALIVAGKTYQATAETLGVSRATVSGWANHNAAFAAEVNRLRQELWGSLVDRLRGLAPRAVEILEAALETEEAVSVALSVLKICGFPGANVAP